MNESKPRRRKVRLYVGSLFLKKRGVGYAVKWIDPNHHSTTHAPGPALSFLSLTNSVGVAEAYDIGRRVRGREEVVERRKKGSHSHSAYLCLSPPLIPSVFICRCLSLICISVSCACMCVCACASIDNLTLQYYPLCILSLN